MERISLYRKWRPQTFGEVIGQRHVTETLANALSSGRLVHAYLFCGPRGTGKTSTARILAKAINCGEGPTATPCNTCEACVSISEGTALDVIEIDAASNRKIDEIRELLEKIPYTPTALRSKVYIIDEVHQLTPEASSALLKTLEEPPGHVRFVLATTEPHKILPTIISRCQRFDFSLVSTPEISQLLEHIASREEIDIEPEALGMIAEHAHGSVRDAIGVMDQISNLAGERVTQRQLAEMLGEVESKLIFEMVDLVIERDTPGILSLVGTMVDSGKDPRRFVESLIAHLRSLFLIQNAHNPREIVEVTDEHYARLSEQVKGLRRYEVVRLIERLGETHREMRFSENARLVLECALVKATRVDVDISLEGLIFRLDELERKVESLGGEAAAPAVAGAPAKPAAKPARKRAAGAPDEVKAGTVAEEATFGKEDVKVREPRPDEKVAEKEEPAFSRGAKVDPAEREKARRGWTAVLADLKKQGKMKVYALLTKARIREVRDGELVIGFPEDAAFQKGRLEESGEVSQLEEVWERIVGEPVKITLAGAAPRKAPLEAKKAEAPPAKAKKTVVKKAAEPESASGEAGSAGPPGGKSGKDIARLLSEQFDGEIIEGEGRKE